MTVGVVRRTTIVRGLHTWLTVSSVVLAWVMVRTGPNPNIIAFKDVAIFGALGIYLVIVSRSWDKVSGRGAVRSIPLLGVLVAAIILARGDALATLASLRQLVAPYALIAVGWLAVRTVTDFERLLATIRRNLWVLFAFGLVERVIGWGWLPLRPYFAAKNLGLEPRGVPTMFIEPIFGGIDRMASLLLDPINTGHSLVALMCIELARGGRKGQRNALVAAGGVALTFSKGAIVHVALVVWWLNRNVPRAIRFYTAALAAVVVGAYGHLHGGIAVHIDGFVASFGHLSLFGHGLGASGNQAALFGDTAATEGIGDSFVGAIIGQIGVVGLVVWVWPLVSFARRLPKNLLLRRLFVGQLFVAALSENSFNLLSVYSVCLLLGAAMSVQPRPAPSPRRVRPLVPGLVR